MLSRFNNKHTHNKKARGDYVSTQPPLVVIVILCLLQVLLYVYLLVCLDKVAHLHVVVVGDVQATLVASEYLFDVVFEAFE